MTDNALLGEVESTFYRICKKHGVQSVQIEDLNRLFASLVDRHPTSLNAFAKLRNSVIGDMTVGECVWEEMTATQTAVTALQRKFVPMNYRASYGKFRDALAWQVLHMRISENSHHFNECMLWANVAETMSRIDHLCKCDSVRSAGIDDESDEMSWRREVSLRAWRVAIFFTNPTFSYVSALILLLLLPLSLQD
jgi:hypothetical protein